MGKSNGAKPTFCEECENVTEWVSNDLGDLKYNPHFACRLKKHPKLLYPVVKFKRLGDGFAAIKSIKGVNKADKQGEPCEDFVQRAPRLGGRTY